MSDEKKKDVPITLESLSDQMTALGKSIDTQFDELKAQLRTEIEAVDANVKLVYDIVIAQTDRHNANDKTHKRFEKRLDDHDTRILALEKPNPQPPEPAPPARS